MIEGSYSDREVGDGIYYYGAKWDIVLHAGLLRGCDRLFCPSLVRRPTDRRDDMAHKNPKI